MVLPMLMTLCCSAHPQPLLPVLEPVPPLLLGPAAPTHWMRLLPQLGMLPTAGGHGFSLSCLQPSTKAFHWQNLSRNHLAEGSGQCGLLTQPPEIQRNGAESQQTDDQQCYSKHFTRLLPLHIYSPPPSPTPTPVCSVLTQPST